MGWSGRVAAGARCGAVGWAAAPGRSERERPVTPCLCRFGRAGPGPVPHLPMQPVDSAAKRGRGHPVAVRVGCRGSEQLAVLFGVCIGCEVRVADGANHRREVQAVRGREDAVDHLPGVTCC
jgi:hypothetical protein